MFIDLFFGKFVVFNSLNCHKNEIFGNSFELLFIWSIGSVLFWWILLWICDLVFQGRGLKSIPWKMGVMLRRVLPICGKICFFYPSQWARSIQPVKQYKNLLADIFPRSQESIWLPLYRFYSIVMSLWRNLNNFCCFRGQLAWLFAILVLLYVEGDYFNVIYQIHCYWVLNTKRKNC